MDGYITMSHKELDRYDIINRVIEKRLTQPKAASMLGLSVRQIRRLMRSVEAKGASGLVSKRRGRPSNNQVPSNIKEAAITLIKERYSDFRPTFASEKLAELHDIRISAETIRRWMIEAGLWKTRSQLL